MHIDTYVHPKLSYETKSKLEEIYNEAKSILNLKNKQIDELYKKIKFEEQTIFALKDEYKRKQEEYKNIKTDGSKFDEEDIERQIKLCKDLNEEEMNNIIRKHEEQIELYKLQFSKSLKDAEKWSQDHINAIHLEKQAELESLKTDLHYMKEKERLVSNEHESDKKHMLSTKRQATVQSSNRANFLETQLTELTSTTREELKLVKAKIEEVLTTISLREKEHEMEIMKYKDEIAKREQSYKESICSNDSENKTKVKLYKEQIEITRKNVENLATLLKEMERYHSKQLEKTMKDSENMKSTIYQARSKLGLTTTQAHEAIDKTSIFELKTQEMEQEIKIIDVELKELNDENSSLKIELEKLSKELYGRA